ncbi:MAG: hypothetical protein LC624_09415 [Halobacteriales archaeon]|nr:hypothetical protein [Halobacteriales archaeon]
MGFEDVLLPAGLFNLVTLVAALGLYAWKRPSRPALRVLFIVIAGTGFHLLTDLFFDLGTDGEHLLMHAVALGAVLVLALP